MIEGLKIVGNRGIPMALDSTPKNGATLKDFGHAAGDKRCWFLPQKGKGALMTPELKRQVAAMAKIYA